MTIWIPGGPLRDGRVLQLGSLINTIELISLLATISVSSLKILHIIAISTTTNTPIAICQKTVVRHFNNRLALKSKIQDNYGFWVYC